MATPEATQADDPRDDPAGTFRLDPEEEEELVAAMAEAEADRAEGQLRPVRDMIRDMRGDLGLS